VLGRAVDRAADDLVRLDPLEAARTDDILIDAQIMAGVVVAIGSDGVGRAKRTHETAEGRGKTL